MGSSDSDWAIRGRGDDTTDETVGRFTIGVAVGRIKHDQSRTTDWIT